MHVIACYQQAVFGWQAQQTNATADCALWAALSGCRALTAVTTSLLMSVDTSSLPEHLVEHWSDDHLPCLSRCQHPVQT